MRKTAISRRPFFVLVAVFYIAVVLAVAFLSMTRGRRLVMDAVDTRLKSAAASLAFLLADDFHDRALDSTSIPVEEELRNRERLNAFVKVTEVTWAYTLVRRGGMFYFTALTVDEEDLKESPWWYFHPYVDAPAAFHRALEKGEATYANYSDRWGTFRSVALPRRSPGGRPYLACVDLPLSDLRAIERAQLLQSLLASLILLLALLPIILLYRWEITANSRSLTYMNERLKDAAQASEERFRRLFEHSADAVAVLNAWELVEYVNPAFSNLFGWPRGELVGRSLPIAPDDEKKEAASLVEALRDRAEAYRDLETRRITKNGTVLDVSISGAPLADSRGGFAGSLLIIRDRTQRRRLEERLAQGEKLRAVSSLAAGAAHDFNNALMIIQGNVSLLELECELGEKGREIMKGIHNALHSASALTRELLDFAHTDKSELEPTDVAAVATEAVMTYLGSRPGLRSEMKFSEGKLIARARREGLGRVLVNLLVNADHAMSGSGTVCVSAEPMEIDAASAAQLSVSVGKYIALRVSDSGCGMPDEVRKHLFEPLFTTKKHGVGTGLGLATAYATIHSFGGAIDVESEEGCGSTFSLYLPAASIS